MLFNGRARIFSFSRTQVRIAEIERLQSLFKISMVVLDCLISQIFILLEYNDINIPLKSINTLIIHLVLVYDRPYVRRSHIQCSS